MTEPVGELTPESIERIYEVNMIRDHLQSKESTERLKSLGVESIVFYGTAMKGKAKKTSDTDIYIIHKGKEDFGFDYNNKDEDEKEKMKDMYEKNLSNIIKGSGTNEVVVHGLQYFLMSQQRNKNLEGVIHLFIVGKDEEPNTYNKKTKRLSIIESEESAGIEIWSNSDKRPNRNLLSRLFRIK